MADPSRPVTGYPAYPNGGPPLPQQPQSYPYAAAPPYQNNPNPDPYPYRPVPSRVSFIRAFIAGIILVFVIIAAILFIIWLVLRPRVPEFRLDSLRVTNLSVASQSVSAVWIAGFSVYNPNKKMTVSYDEIVSSIFYHSDFLSQSRLTPFTQAKKNQTSITASFSTTDSYISGRALNDLNRDRARGSVNFDLQILARAGFRAGRWRTRRRILRVLCTDVSVGLSSPNGTASGSGNLTGGLRKCRVRI